MALPLYDHRKKQTKKTENEYGTYVNCKESEDKFLK